MPSNLDRYKKDLDSLLEKGDRLSLAIQAECHPLQFEEALTKRFDKDGATQILKNLPSFRKTYQSWYSEAKALIRQLLPDRLSDFVRLYEKPALRRNLKNSWI